MAAQRTSWGTRLDGAADILKQSYMVQFFFMSSEKAETSVRTDTWLQEVVAAHDHSLLRQVLRVAGLGGPVAVTPFRVSVRFDDNRWYGGRCDRYDSAFHGGKPWHITYDDGTAEWARIPDPDIKLGCKDRGVG